MRHHKCGEKKSLSRKEWIAGQRLQGGPERQGLRPIRWKAAGSIRERLLRGGRNRRHLHAAGLRGEWREKQEDRDNVGLFFQKFLRRERGLEAGKSRVEEGWGREAEVEGGTLRGWDEAQALPLPRWPERGRWGHIQIPFGKFQDSPLLGVGVWGEVGGCLKPASLQLCCDTHVTGEVSPKPVPPYRRQHRAHESPGLHRANE